MAETTYTAVTWTAGDTITEAKLDNMVSNGRAIDAMAQGVEFEERADPSTPATNKIHMFAKDRSGIPALYAIDDSGVVAEVIDSTNIIATATDAAPTNFDITVSRLFHVSITANRTFAFNNIVATNLKAFAILITNGGSNTVTWPSGIDWTGGSAPTLSTTSGDTDCFVIIPKPTWVASSNEVYWGLFAGFGMA